MCLGPRHAQAMVIVRVLAHSAKAVGSGVVNGFWDCVGIWIAWRGGEGREVLRMEGCTSPAEYVVG